MHIKLRDDISAQRQVFILHSYSDMMMIAEYYYQVFDQLLGDHLIRSTLRMIRIPYFDVSSFCFLSIITCQQKVKSSLFENISGKRSRF